MDTDDVLPAEDLMDMFEKSIFGESSSQAPVFTAPTPFNQSSIKTVNNEVADFKRPESGTEYAKRFQLLEEKLVVNRALNMPSTSRNDIDDGLNIEHSNELQEMPELDVFNRYQFNLPPPKLPILQYRKEIIKEIRDRSVVVFSAFTGTGKSSQIPQYIIEDAFKRKENCNIIVAQPRRIAGKHEKLKTDTKFLIKTLTLPQL
jgi:ATP-dependent RNA helicase TDRD9